MRKRSALPSEERERKSKKRRADKQPAALHRDRKKKKEKVIGPRPYIRKVREKN